MFCTGGHSCEHYTLKLLGETLLSTAPGQLSAVCGTLGKVFIFPKPQLNAYKMGHNLTQDHNMNQMQKEFVPRT